jgi:CRISPR/Cas system-associated protein Cas5 (RAMP superfamily)
MVAPVTMVAVMMTPAPIAMMAIAPTVTPTAVAPAAVMPPVTAVIGLLYDAAIAGVGDGFHNGDVAANCCGLGTGRCET